MISVNNVFEKISSEHGWIQKLVLGSILMFIPIINIFALGYLWQYTGHVLDSGDLRLPRWENWGRLFWGGLIFLAIIVAYGLVIFGLGWLLSLLLSALSFGALGLFPFFPLSIASAIAPSLTVMGLFSLKKRQNIELLARDLKNHFKRLISCWPRLFVANFAFMGCLIFGAPIYGFALFVGFLILIPYTALILIEDEIRKKD